MGGRPMADSETLTGSAAGAPLANIATAASPSIVPSSTFAGKEPASFVFNIFSLPGFFRPVLQACSITSRLIEQVVPDLFAQIDEFARGNDAALARARQFDFAH